MNWRASWRSKPRRLSTCSQGTASPKRRRTPAPFPWMSRRKSASTFRAWRTPRRKRKPRPRRKKTPRTLRRKRRECGQRPPPQLCRPSPQFPLRRQHRQQRLRLPQPNLQRLPLPMRFRPLQRQPQLRLSRRHLPALRRRRSPRQSLRLRRLRFAPQRPPRVPGELPRRNVRQLPQQSQAKVRRQQHDPRQQRQPTRRRCRGWTGLLLRAHRGIKD